MTGICLGLLSIRARTRDVCLFTLLYTALIYRYHDLDALAEAVGILPTDHRLRPALILGLNAGVSYMEILSHACFLRGKRKVRAQSLYAGLAAYDTFGPTVAKLHEWLQPPHCAPCILTDYSMEAVRLAQVRACVYIHT